jgi:hypothetical protein
LDFDGRSTSTNLNDKSREKLDLFLKTFSLVDVTKIADSSIAKKFTWSNGRVHSRLDYFFVTPNLLDKRPVYNVNTVINSQLGHRLTDHKAISLISEYEGSDRGPGLWKFNNSLLDNKEFIKQITLLIDEVIENNQNLSAFLRWEVLKRKIKDFTIYFASRLSKKRNDLEKSLIAELEVFDNKPVLSEREKLDKAVVENRLSEIYENKAAGSIIRSKLNTIETKKGMNSFFKNLEISRQAKNTFKSLRARDGSRVQNTHEILNLMLDFYSSLYTSTNISDDEISEYLENDSQRHDPGWRCNPG